MIATEFGRRSAPQSPTEVALTRRPPKRAQNGPSLSTTMSSIPSALPPQQSNQSAQARQVDFMKTSVVVVAAPNEIERVWPAGTTI